MKYLYIVIISILISCSQEKPKTPIIYLKKVYSQVGDTTIYKDSIYQLNDRYFEIGLNSAGRYFVATKQIKEIKINHGLISESIEIVDSLNEFIKFNSSSEFLNYIDAHGYKLVSQIPKKYGTDYTLEKK